MKLESDELAALMLRVAKERFGEASFERRTLMILVEKEARAMGAWEPADNALSGSAGIKSRGLAAIDYRFSDLAHRHFVNLRRGLWRLAKTAA